MDDEKVLNINNELNNIDWDIIDHLDIDDAYNVMVSQIQIALNAHAEKTIQIPKKILRQTWMTTALLKSSQTKNILFYIRHFPRGKHP